MARFNVFISDHRTSKQFIHNFDEMKYAKQFAKRSLGLRQMADASITIMDNKVNTEVYYAVNVNGKTVSTNLSLNY